ncbi:MAG TPA: hypothetical protein VK968_03335, partial [Roseimicrobium sp.]|nr:hypothetical protein [Roseimicrobium sp.]
PPVTRGMVGRYAAVTLSILIVALSLLRLFARGLGGREIIIIALASGPVLLIGFLFYWLLLPLLRGPASATLQSATVAANRGSRTNPAAQGIHNAPSRFSRTVIAGLCVWLLAVPFLSILGLFLRHVIQRASMNPDVALPGMIPFSGMVLLSPAVFAPLLATALGWVAIDQIRRSEGKLRGLRLAFIEAILLPAGVTLGLLSWFWFWLFRDVIAASIHAPHRELSTMERILIQNSTGLAMVASFVSGLLVAIFGVRFLWKWVNGVQSAPKAQSSSERVRVPAWMSICAFSVCVVVFVIINWVRWTAPTGVWTADGISNSGPNTGDVVVKVEKVTRFDHTVWVLLNTSTSNGKTVGIRPRFSGWMTSLPPVLPIRQHVEPPVGQEVVLELIPGNPPYELSMSSRDVTDVSGPGQVWIGFNMPGVQAAAAAADQIAQLHLNHPQGLTSPNTALLLFSLTSRSVKPASDQKLIGDLMVDPGPQSPQQKTGAVAPYVRPGQIIDIVLPDPAPGVACLLDFETGRFITPPPELAKKLAEGVAAIGDDAAQWLKTSGADAAVRLPDRGALSLFEGIAFTYARNPNPPLRWDQFTDSDVAAALAGATFEQQQRFVNSGRGYYATPAMSPAALAFMTREGSTGVMEVLGANANPAGIRIRYRLVRVVATPPSPKVSSSTSIPVRKGFVRNPESLALDDKGSQLAFITAADGNLSFSIAWWVGSGRSELAMKETGFFKAVGWFVYIESPMRLWLYDGAQQLDLIHHDGTKMSRVSAKSPGIYELCPAPVREAVPESVRP